MAPYMGLLQGMSLRHKQIVVTFLTESMREKEYEKTDMNESTIKQEAREKDEQFVRDFLATPYDNPMTADEAKRMIRESHHLGERTFKPLHNMFAEVKL